MVPQLTINLTTLGMWVFLFSLSYDELWGLSESYQLRRSHPLFLGWRQRLGKYEIYYLTRLSPDYIPDNCLDHMSPALHWAERSGPMLETFLDFY